MNVQARPAKKSKFATEEQTVPHLVKKYPAFCGNKKFIIASKHTFILPYPEPNNSRHLRTAAG